MARYVVFLRGMNLGNRRISNPELIASFEALGFENVVAFLASGNVVFDARRRASGLERHIEGGLASALGYEVPAFVRTDQQVQAISGTNSFAGRPVNGTRGKEQVAFLKRAPSTALMKRVAGFDSDEDWLTIRGGELYWWPIGGMSQSALDLKALAEIVGPMTIRARATIERLTKKYLAAA